MEGVNMAAILAGYLAILAFGIMSLVAFGLLIARHTKPARILFAAGLLCAATIVAVAMLSFLAPEFYHDGSAPMIVVTAVSLFLAGAGQFVAALRSAWTYAAAFGCAAVSMVLVASPLLGGDWGVEILGGLGRRLAELGVPFLVVASLLPAVASVGIAVFLPFRSRQTESERPEAKGRA